MFSGLKGFFFTPPDPQFDPMKFNFDTDPARLNDTSVLQDSLLTFLSTFSARGSKLMLIHGMSDPFFSAYDTARYYERVVQDNGGLDKTMSWVRYFEVPGMNHCGGGPALEDFDPLTAPSRLTAFGHWSKHRPCNQSACATVFWPDSHP